MSHGRRWERFSNKLAIASMAALLAGSSAAMAQDVAEPAAAPAPNTGAISVSAGFDVVTEYWFRGIPQQDQGLIIQPYASISAALWSQDEWSLGATVGTWNSIHSNAPDTEVDGWYEADWSFGIDIGLPAGFGASAYYVVLYSPEGGDTFAEEIDLGLSFDDSSLWGDTGIPGFTGIQPYALLAIETQAGSDALGSSGDEGIYLEFGIGPGFTLINTVDYPVSLSFPVKVGLGLDNYYEHPNATATAVEDETFGFVSVGGMVSVPLSFVPAQFGTWSANAGITALFLNNDYVDGTADYGDDDIRVIGTFGISMDY